MTENSPYDRNWHRRVTDSNKIGEGLALRISLIGGKAAVGAIDPNYVVEAPLIDPRPYGQTAGQSMIVPSRMLFVEIEGKDQTE